mmetsp:Transcript_8585/g.12816  ORF Transcript_8585/g.12816 Transcript_8585/m.12816 type:complete len:115 (+) Transcript_8585:144-488(+)
MANEICRHHNNIENRGLAIIRDLERQSLKQDYDQRECETLARDLGRLLQRWRRSTNLSVETMNELTSELNREQRSLDDLHKRLRDAEDSLGAFTRESINVNAAILQLEQTLDIS